MRSKAATSTNATTMTANINSKNNNNNPSEGAGGLTSDEFLGRQAAFKAKVQVKSDVQVTIQVKPPPAAVKTIRELIYWEYAKLIAKAAGFDKNYRFIMSRYIFPILAKTMKLLY
jgi:hypothetical protein